MEIEFVFLKRNNFLQLSALNLHFKTSSKFAAKNCVKMSKIQPKLDFLHKYFNIAGNKCDLRGGIVKTRDYACDPVFISQVKSRKFYLE